MKKEEYTQRFAFTVNLKVREKIRKLATVNECTLGFIVNKALYEWNKCTDEEKKAKMYANFENTLDEYSMVYVNVYLTEMEKYEIQEEAERFGLSKQRLIRHVVYSYLREQEEKTEEKAEEQEKVEEYDGYDLLNQYYDYLDGLKQLSDDIRAEDEKMEEEDKNCEILNIENDAIYEQMFDRLQRFNEKLLKLAKDTEKIIKGYNPLLDKDREE